jgi:hypothetical protein
MIARPAAGFSQDEMRLLKTLRTPADIQAFLDGIVYSADDFSRTPLRVLKDRQANCFDGAMFAAAAFQVNGSAPLLLDMRAVNDDDHVIAVYRRHGCLGAVAKSNFVGLRFREPVYRTVRELVMSYFEDYYNTAREKTMRSYSRPLDVRSIKGIEWLSDEKAPDAIADQLDSMRHYPVMTRAMILGLNLTDERRCQAGLLGANKAGLFVPGKE